MKTSLLLVAIATIICVAPTPATAILGGWSKIINITNPHIQELGKWGVMEFNKVGNDNLTFRKVVSGEEQTVHGINYRLVIVTQRHDGSHGKYMEGLFEEDSSNPNTRNLMSFNPTN
uniref:Uncharacterized protein n=1 Tax=Avena sativa TaxID=4498 RepID=A0ACD5WYT9_AVESA